MLGSPSGGSRQFRVAARAGTVAVGGTDRIERERLTVDALDDDLVRFLPIYAVGSSHSAPGPDARARRRRYGRSQRATGRRQRGRRAASLLRLLPWRLLARSGATVRRQVAAGDRKMTFRLGIRALMPTPTTCRPWRKTIGGAPLGRRLGDRKAPMGQPDAVLGPTRGSVPSGPPRATPPVAPARPVGGAEHGRQVRGPGRPRLPAPAIGGGPPVPGQYPGGPLADGSGLPGQLRAEACRGDRHRSARGGAPGVVQLGEVGAKVTSWSHGRRARCPAAAGRWHRPPRVRADGSHRAGAAVCVGRPIAPSPGSILPAGNQARLTSRR